MRLSSLKPGMIIYDVGRRKMGNTTLSTVSVWTVEIVSVDLDDGSVVARWNGNPPQTYGVRSITKWRLAKPVLIRGLMGQQRLATREELKAMKLQKEQTEQEARQPA